MVKKKIARCPKCKRFIGVHRIFPEQKKMYVCLFCDKKYSLDDKRI